MQSTPLVRHILRDEAVTRGLGDIEARMIVEWLESRAEEIAETAPTEDSAWAAIRKVCRRARAISCFVRLWADPDSHGAAIQLAAAEQMFWPLPTGEVDLGELMADILGWVDRQDEIVEESLARRAA